MLLLLAACVTPPQVAEAVVCVFAVTFKQLPAFLSYRVVIFFSFLSILAPSQYIWPFDLVLLKRLFALE